MLQELFARFGLPDTIISYNGTQFTSKEFENFCKLFSINHLKSVPYHPRSNGLVERFIDVFKRAIKKANGIKKENEELQEFLSIYPITHNPDINANMSPAELMLARKIRSIFDKLIPLKKEIRKKLISLIRLIVRWNKIYFLNYHLGKTIWLEGIIKKRIGNMMYIIKHPRWKVRRHMNQIKKNNPNTKKRVEEPMSVIYDMFEVPRPSPIQQYRTSKRKRTLTGTMEINPERQKFVVLRTY